MEVPALAYMLEAYFHQDFYEVNGGVWETVDAFVAKDPHRAVDVPKEVAKVLAALPTEAEVEAFVQSTGCEYVPQPDGNGYRGWLTEIARRVSAAVDGAGPA